MNKYVSWTREQIDEYELLRTVHLTPEDDFDAVDYLNYLGALRIDKWVTPTDRFNLNHIKTSRSLAVISPINQMVGDSGDEWKEYLLPSNVVKFATGIDYVIYFNYLHYHVISGNFGKLGLIIKERRGRNCDFKVVGGFEPIYETRHSETYPFDSYQALILNPNGTMGPHHWIKLDTEDNVPRNEDPNEYLARLCTGNEWFANMYDKEWLKKYQRKIYGF